LNDIRRQEAGASGIYTNAAAQDYAVGRSIVAHRQSAKSCRFVKSVEPVEKYIYFCHGGHREHRGRITNAPQRLCARYKSSIFIATKGTGKQTGLVCGLFFAFLCDPCGKELISATEGTENTEEDKAPGTALLGVFIL